MQPFEYARPSTLSDVFDLFDDHGADASMLAGGTDLIVALRNQTLRPKVVVDLKRVAELRSGIGETSSSLTVNANTVLADLNDHPRIQTLFPALVEAAAVVGSIQIRNRATLTGNICHASPAADTAPALLVYGAVVNVTSASGSRRVNLNEFFVGPRQTVLQQGELATSIDLPITGERRGATFARITRRRGVDLATINLCCLVEASGRTLFAFGAVGPRPFLVADDSGVLADPATSEAAKDDVLRRLLAQASPISDVRGSREYREAMLLVMSRRALSSSIERLRAA
jgi:CO/xanthine dehydrogenase FAD-binding subunit